MRGIEHVVLALGALQKVEDNEARHVFEMRLAREPDLLEIAFGALLHLEPIHGDVHSRLLPIMGEHLGRRSSARRLVVLTGYVLGGAAHHDHVQLQSSTSGGRNMSSSQAARTAGSALVAKTGAGIGSTPSLTTITSISPTRSA